ncbi:MAG: AAA family ATPase [bacterium]|nr:AAA family ATPase [bacterium]
MPQAPVKVFEGREQELELLLERWQHARDGDGQIVLIAAEAGLGKSRLIELFAERTEASTVLRGRCSPRYRTTAYAPLRDLLGRLETAREIGGEGDKAEGPPAPEERQRGTLIARLRTLLSGSRQRAGTALNLNPEGQPKKTLEELLALFLDSAKQHPMLLVIEDLEWADPSTLELLSHLVHRKPTASLMVVLTFASDFDPPWGQRAYFTSFVLGRLSRRQQESLLEALTRGKPLTSTQRAEILAIADGMPLMIEELVALAQTEDPPSPLPVTLAHCLTARLDSLGSARQMTELAAVVGDELAGDLLEDLSDLASSELRHAQERLVTAGILRRHGTAGFAFEHLLIRDAIYDSVPEPTRRDAHRRIAEALAARPTENGGHEPELTARHYAEAGMTEEAVAAWRRAAEQAVKASALLEAAQRAREGLQLLESLADEKLRTAEETALQITLGAALGTANGYAMPEAQAAYDRALELAWQAPQAAGLAPAMQELASYYLSRGQVRAAREIAEEAVRRAGGSRQGRTLTTAHRTLGFALMLEGNFPRSEESLSESLGPYAADGSRQAPQALGIPLAESLSHLSLASWFLGRPDQAVKQSADSLTLARRSGDPFSRVFTTYRACFLHVFRREPTATRELAHELVELANRHGFLFFIAAGMFLEGQALTAQSRAAEGLQMMSGGLDGVWASGMEVGRPRNLALLAEACGRSDLVEQGLSLIKEGLAAVEITGECHYEAELHRIEGELLLRSGVDDDEAEASFQQALTVARSQSSASLELRAAISLSRLWHRQDETSKARELLADAYGQFEEGFDTADLREAKELLDEMG